MCVCLYGRLFVCVCLCVCFAFVLVYLIGLLVLCIFKRCLKLFVRLCDGVFLCLFWVLVGLCLLVCLFVCLVA